MAKTNPRLADQNTHVSWKATSLRESALERLYKKIHEDRMAAMEFNSLSHYNLVRNPDAKAAVDKEVRKARKHACMANDQSQEQKRGHSRGTESGKDRSFCHTNGRMPPQKLGVRSEVPIIQRTCCAPR